MCQQNLIWDLHPIFRGYHLEIRSRSMKIAYTGKTEYSVVSKETRMQNKTKTTTPKQRNTRWANTHSHSSAKLQQKIVFILYFKYIPVTLKHTVLDLFNVCSNHATLNYSGQEFKHNLQFMILTYLWPWNKVKVIKPGMNC